MSDSAGQLYIVATPIGNLGDITRRAVDVLQQVDFIGAEDTRHSRQLLNHLGLSKPMVALHEHNERDRAGVLLQRLENGESMALISDAGTPLISDPGYHIVRQARDRGIRVVPVPGASALIAALSVSGLPTDHFRFQGFLPHKSSARRSVLEQLATESVTLVFYESSHRIKDSIADMADVLGGEREAVITRELTKTFETVLGNTLEEIHEQLLADSNQCKGEFVIVVRGAEAKSTGADDAQIIVLLKLLLEELPLKTASKIIAKHFGLSKKDIYKTGLDL